LFVVTSGSEIATKSIHLLLFTLVTFGNGGSRWSACSVVYRKLWHCSVIGWGRRGRSWGQRNGSWLAGYF